MTGPWVHAVDMAATLSESAQFALCRHVAERHRMCNLERVAYRMAPQSFFGKSNSPKPGDLHHIELAASPWADCT